MKRLLVSLLATCLSVGLVWLGGSCQKKDVDPVLSDLPDLNRTKPYVHAPDVAQLLSRVMTPGTYDLSPVFLDSIAQPDAYYTDFFGIQALRDRTPEQIKSDFVPKHATIIRQDTNTLTLRFQSGWQAVFYLNTALQILGNTVPIDHVDLGGDTYTTLLQHRTKFRQLLRQEQLEEQYLFRNPDYSLEVETKRLLPQLALAPVTPDSTLRVFSTQPQAILLSPDTHGSVPIYNRVKQVLSTAEYDWFALEMLSADVQPAVDQYLSSPEGSASFTQARQTILDFYGQHWNNRFAEVTTPENNQYFQLIELARKRGKKVYGLEVVNDLFFLFRYGETPWGNTVRNKGWQQRIPATGRGIVFGGGSHFSDP